MPHWQQRAHAPRRWTADWRVAWPPIGGAYPLTHAVESRGAPWTACSKAVPAYAQRLGFGAVACPDCRATRP